MSKAKCDSPKLTWSRPNWKAIINLCHMGSRLKLKKEIQNGTGLCRYRILILMQLQQAFCNVCSLSRLELVPLKRKENMLMSLNIPWIRCTAQCRGRRDFQGWPQTVFSCRKQPLQRMVSCPPHRRPWRQLFATMATSITALPSQEHSLCPVPPPTSTATTAHWVQDQATPAAPSTGYHQLTDDHKIWAEKPKANSK